MQIDYWADLTGPETLHMHDELRGAIDALGMDGEVEVIWHAFERDRSPGERNTFDAHRCVHLARSAGCERAVFEALASAAAQGMPLGDRSVLVPLVVGAGLDEADVVEMLDGDGCGYPVRVDEATANMAGIPLVPAIVFGQKYILTGVQPYETVIAALTRAWEEKDIPPEQRESAGCGGGCACGAGGCGA